MDILKINGTVMPRVKKLTITPEKIWSKNTGRVSNGDMKGDLITIKLKAHVEFAPLTDEQAILVDAAVSPPSFEAEFRNPRNGKTEPHTMYAGSPVYPVYSFVEGYPRYVGSMVELIEI